MGRQTKRTVRLTILIPPNRTAVENGMEILGWAKHSSMLLVQTRRNITGLRFGRTGTGNKSSPLTPELEWYISPIWKQ